MPTLTIVDRQGGFPQLTTAGSENPVGPPLPFQLGMGAGFFASYHAQSSASTGWGLELNFESPPMNTNFVGGQNWMGMIGYNLGGAPRLGTFEQTCALPTMYQTHITQGSVGMVIPIPNSTSPTVIGMGVLTAVGTATARTVANTNFVTRRKRVGYVSAATASAMCGLYFTLATGYIWDNSTREGGFTLTIRFSFSDATMQSGARFFAGVASSVSAPTAVDPSTLTNCIGLVKRAADTTFFVYWAGSATNAANITDTFMDCTAALQVYELSISTQQAYGFGGANFGLSLTNITDQSNYILNPQAGASGTELPAANTLLAPRIWRANNASSPAAAGIDILGLSFESTL